ncbi:MAG: Kazal-type serine protease inhibitor family protein [Thermodesulfobacteriota bacterium]
MKRTDGMRMLVAWAVLWGALAGGSPVWGAVTGRHTEQAMPPYQEGCVTDADCGDDASLFCLHPAGSCQAVGQCRSRPTACPDVANPVCGCDGVTYGNACEAAAAGVSVAQAGPCQPPPPVFCTGNTDCRGEDQYCAKLPGNCDGQGTCEPRPRICPVYDAAMPFVWMPVCGCDGRTYDSACAAAAAGVPVRQDGRCQEDCWSDWDCGPGEFCKEPDGRCLEPVPLAAVAPDCLPGTARCIPPPPPGTCTVIPTACPEIYAPVCGCDGLTYDNSCLADGAGVSVAHTGPCVPPTPATPDLKANGADGPLTVLAWEPVRVTIALDPGSHAGEPARWWLLAATPGGWYSYAYPIGWRPGIGRGVMLPIVALPPSAVIASPLPEGRYTFLFAVQSISRAVWADALQLEVVPGILRPAPAGR